MNIVIIEHDFEEKFFEMPPSCIYLDITVERSPCFDYPIFPLSHSQCDYYEEFDKPVQILVAFTSVLLWLFVNYVLKF